MGRAGRRGALRHVVAVVCALPLLLVASPAQGQGAGQAPRGQITVGITQFPDTLNPFQGGISVDPLIGAAVFSPYAYLDGHGRLVPDLLDDIPSVQNHQLRDGGRTVILRLRPHRYWSSGAEITSADVMFGWKMDRDTLTGPACLVNGCIVRSMRAAGRYTVVARLTHFPPDDVLSWLPDLVPSGWKKLGHNPHTAATRLYQDASFDYENPGFWTDGPYQPQSVVNNDEVMLRLARHSASTNEPHVARLRYAFYSTPGDLIGALTSDTADIGAGFTATDLPALRQAAPGSFRIVVQPTYTLEHLELNVGSTQFRGQPNPLTDVRVRQALALATDRLGLMRDVLHLGPLQVRDLAAYSPWQTAPYVAEPGADRDITGAWDPIAQRYLPYGPRALRDARSLLAEAGYPQGLDLELYKPSRPNLRSAETQFISQDWSRIGVRVSAETQRNCSLGCGFDYAPPWEQGNFQALLIALAGSPGPGSLKRPLLPNPTPTDNPDGPLRAFDYAGIDDPQLVRDWKSAEAATTSAQRNAWYRRIQERVIRQAYWIPLYWWPQITAVSPRVQGFGQSAEAPVWRPQDWRLGG